MIHAGTDLKYMVTVAMNGLLWQNDPAKKMNTANGP